MEKDNGAFLVSRDEARLFKAAAALTANMPLTLLCAHYLGVRTSAEGKRIPKFSPEIVSPDMYNELITLPVHVKRHGIEDIRAGMDMRNVDLSVNNMSYVYGPKLADLAVHSLRSALDDRLIRPAHRIEQAETIIRDYTNNTVLGQE